MGKVSMYTSLMCTRPYSSMAARLDWWKRSAKITCFQPWMPPFVC